MGKCAKQFRPFLVTLPLSALLLAPTASLGQTTTAPVPIALDIKSDGTTAYIANTGSSFVTAVDLTKLAVTGVINIQRPDPSNPGTTTASNTSGVKISPDGTKLLVTEFRGSEANLLVYSMSDLPLECPSAT